MAHPHHTVEEILAAPTVTTHQSIQVILEVLFGTRGYPDMENLWSIHDAMEKDHKIRTECKAYHQYDGRRFAELSVVFYLDEPIAIVNRMGREGDDRQASWILNTNLFAELKQYVVGLLNQVTDNEITETIDLKTKIPMPMWENIPATLGKDLYGLD